MITFYTLGLKSEVVVWYFFLYENHSNHLFVSFNIINNYLTNVHVSPRQREKLLFISKYKLVTTKGVAILLSSDGKTWKLLDEIDDWSIRPFTTEPKKNHIKWRECNTESYQRSKPSSLSNKRQPLLLWTFESLTHSHLSSQELFYCIYQYTTTIKINVKRENR